MSDTSSELSSIASSAFVRLSSTPSLTIAEQSIGTIPTAATASTVEELPFVLVGGRKYVREEYISKKRPRRSWIYKHGFALLNFESKEAFWACKYCDEKRSRKLYAAASTTNAVVHLKTHNVHGNGREVDEEGGGTSDLFERPTTVLSMLKANFSKRSKILQTKPLVDAFRDLLVRWIVTYQIAFIAVEAESFRDLLSLGSKTLADLIPTGDTIRTWVMQEFEKRKAEIQAQILQESSGMIHLSFDLWTSPNCISIMAVVAHYCDNSHINRTRLIALRRLRGSHSGENMAKLLVEIVREYEIAERVGFLMIDNAESNDTCLHQFLLTIQPHLSVQERKQRRLRCWGHVLNLATKSFLFGADPDAFEVEIAINTQLRREQAEREIWQRLAAISMVSILPPPWFMAF
jgi:hypothetical protein